MKILTAKIISLSCLLAFFGFTAVIPNGLIYAQQDLGANNVGDIIKRLDDTAKDSNIFSDDKPAPTVFEYVGRFINLFLAFLGVIFLVIVIYSGFTWMMAKGNQQMVDDAVKHIESAAIGIIIILLSYIFINFLVFRIMGIGTGLPQ
ncbi:MAG: hypothetical protein Q8P32_00675 [Candidatus Komeilibacteria bacterium]|nr:hypothetical protein [Candidatus Komeilibacteria bacterium]